MIEVVTFAEAGMSPSRVAKMERKMVVIIWVFARSNLMVMSTLPGLMSASSSFSRWFVVMIRTRPSCEATPSRMLRSAEREMRPPWGLVGGLAGFMTVVAGRVVTRGLASSSVSFGFLRVCVRPAVSMSSSKTTHCFGSSENKVPRFSSFIEGELRLTI